MTISKYDDVIDSRDVIERIEELESALQDLFNDGIGSSDTDISFEAWVDNSILEECQELKTLKALDDDCRSLSANWKYGESLVHRNYFEQYVEEMLQDCGDLPRNLPHYLYIDWEKTAGCIEQDYTSVDFDGQEYLIRNC